MKINDKDSSFFIPLKSVRSPQKDIVDDNDSSPQEKEKKNQQTKDL
jgi:hypothetical protein